MKEQSLLLPIVLPLVSGVLVLCLPRVLRWVQEAVAVVAALFSFLAVALVLRQDANLILPWLGFGIEFSLRLYPLSRFILLAVCFLSFCVALYSVVCMRARSCAKQFFAYFLFSLACINGAVLADNLVLLLFFWEGLLGTLFGLIAIGSKSAYKTATKAFIIVGVSDLCLMVGIGIVGYLAHTLTISKIQLPLQHFGNVAFLFLVIGAVAKAGCMPFHTWIPDAATEAPLPFMALFPAAFEKLIGIYFLTRICLDIFKLDPSSWASHLLMILGALTILFAVMMALIQKEYKRLLSYHAISQVGYMVLGIGTALPIGIVGGLFHMLNNALYKSCLFLTAGAVEKETGTTDLERLGGIGRKMPLTFVSFFIAALSISGVPPFNGFFSKELVYDAALERGIIFYIVALAGSFFTAASFLKLGGAVFLGKLKDENKKVKETHISMLVPMIALALICILFGVCNFLPLRFLIQPAIGIERLEGHDFSGLGKNSLLIVATLFVLSAALLHHVIAVRIKGSALKAADHIHHAPLIRVIYAWAQRRFFDPYEVGLVVVRIMARLLWVFDRCIDWVYESLSAGIARACSSVLRLAHTGSYVTYIIWSLAGTVAVVILFTK